ncbi:MAG TPA: DUF559 domain-containing protein, partial [Streptosporangiaceae bacterium]|nr:DUF559 domain-containing protein [Streptosporangiaceae bacterium]
TLARKDIRPQLGIWATTPARTILDCAPQLDDKRLIRLINDARHRGLITLQALSETARTPKAAARLRALPITPGGPTDSGFEDDFVTFCQRHGLPTPHTNIHLCGLRVDAYFPQHKVIVELDSWKHHQTRDAFERDRERDRITTAAGLLTIRLTHERLTEHEAAQLHRILAAREPG